MLYNFSTLNKLVVPKICSKIPNIALQGIYDAPRIVMAGHMAGHMAALMQAIDTETGDLVLHIVVANSNASSIVKLFENTQTKVCGLDRHGPLRLELLASPYHSAGSLTHTVTALSLNRLQATRCESSR